MSDIQPTGRLLLKINEAAAAISVSRRTFYALIQTNADIRAAVVEIPGVRGKFIRSDLLRRANVDQCRPVVDAHLDEQQRDHGLNRQRRRQSGAQRIDRR